jgi:hypothetical protein
MMTYTTSKEELKLRESRRQYRKKYRERMIKENCDKGNHKMVCTDPNKLWMV